MPAAAPRTRRSPARGSVLVLAITFLAQASGAALGAEPWRGTPELQARAAEFQQARQRAHVWFDQLDLDVATLDSVGIAGKKKLAELLTAYSILARHADDEAVRVRIRSRVENLASQTRALAYHDLGSLSAEAFDAESLSYLRVWWLLRGFGLDTAVYEQAVGAVKGRLDARLDERGPWQRAMFRRYYELLGLAVPDAVAGATMQDGVVASRLPLERFLATSGHGEQRQRDGLVACYQLTHEILVAFDYGERREQDHFDAADLAYLFGVLPVLVRQHVDQHNPDLLSELLLGMAFLGWRDHPAFELGVVDLLDIQNDDGSWGRYDLLRPRWGAYTEHRIGLHTTLVACWALLEGFEGDRPLRSVAAVPPMAAAECLALAREFWSHEQPARAEAAAVHALAITWTDRALANEAVTLLHAQGQLATGQRRLAARLAIADLDELGRGRAHGALAHLAFLDGRDDDVRSHLAQARAIAPQEKTLLMLQILEARRRNDVGALLAILQPMPPTLADSGEAWLHLGEAQFWSGDLDAALASFERSLARDDSLHRAHNAMAWILATERDQAARALPHAERALALGDQVVDYHDTYLEVLERLGRLDDARAHLATIRSRFGDDANLRERARRYGM
jgi:tetratricopeptide (TPR) repeat protein